jgi:IclR family pca regulon transcriptional regulator
MTDASRSERVQSLTRGLAIIRAFDRDRPSMTLSQVAARTQLSRAVARRFLHTLAAENYVVTDGRYFRLTPKVLDLGYAYLSALDLWDVGQPVLHQVAARTGQSCSASVLDGTDIVYVARVAAARIMKVALNVGSRLPAFCSSMGRVLLAAQPPERLARFFAEAKLLPRTPRTVVCEHALRQELARVSAQGFALVDEELESGLRSLSVPVHGRGGDVIAAINVSCHAGGEPAEHTLARCLPVLQAAAADLSVS